MVIKEVSDYTNRTLILSIRHSLSEDDLRGGYSVKDLREEAKAALMTRAAWFLDLYEPIVIYFKEDIIPHTDHQVYIFTLKISDY
jgi:hypothetical protein